MAIRLKDRVEANVRQSDKVNNSLSIQLNSGTATIYDGSTTRSINITPAAIGAATTTHTHTSFADGLKINGHLKLGASTTGDNNYIAFYGIVGDQPGNYNHAYIGENLYFSDECSELVLFKGNDIGSDAANPVNPGPDRIRHIAGAHLFQVYNNALLGTFPEICDSTLPQNIMAINSSNVTIYKNLNVSGTINGNASSASKLQTARTISLTGSVTGSGSFDGSGNLSIATSTNHTHSYLPLSGGTMTGRITFQTIASWPTVDGETYPINSNGIYWNGSSDNAHIFYRVAGSDKGELVFQMGDATDEVVVIENTNGTNYAIIGSHGITMGGNTVLHSGNYSTWAAPVSHRHSITNISWVGTENLSVTGDNTEWSIDMSGANSYFHIWSGALGSSCMQFENDTGICRAPHGVYGGVWNDYAEFRETKYEVEPGRVVFENGDDTLSQTYKRLQPACSVVSDTFGFAIGETDTCKTPLAIAGRVLAYPLEDRYSYKPGDAVCSGPNGTVSKMTREEKVNYPECIIGYVSCVPDYETWGEHDTKVNGRIWIKVV